MCYESTDLIDYGANDRTNIGVETALWEGASDYDAGFEETFATRIVYGDYLVGANRQNRCALEGASLFENRINDKRLVWKFFGKRRIRILVQFFEVVVNVFCELSLYCVSQALHLRPKRLTFVRRPLSP